MFLATKPSKNSKYDLEQQAPLRSFRTRRSHAWCLRKKPRQNRQIDACGNITEYPVPALQKNDILASLAFDHGGNLWVQVYVDHNNPKPSGYDYIPKFDQSIRHIEGPDISGVPFSKHSLPSRGTMMHRIKMDYEGNYGSRK